MCGEVWGVEKAAAVGVRAGAVAAAGISKRLSIEQEENVAESEN